MRTKIDISQDSVQEWFHNRGTIQSKFLTIPRVSLASYLALFRIFRETIKRQQTSRTSQIVTKLPPDGAMKAYSYHIFLFGDCSNFLPEEDW